jgi:alkylation response protein AidB-like acyl-CoA dehydrogenase
MDFSFTETQNDAGELAATLFTAQCTPERLKAVDRLPGRFDRDLWSRTADAGLLGLCLPESAGGSGLGLLELCTVLIEAGKHVAPIPLASHLPAALALAEFGDDAIRAAWLERAVSGDAVLTAAVAEDRDHQPAHPTTAAEMDGDQWLVTGAKTVVPSGTVADLALVTASTPDGVAVFLIDPAGAGVTITPLHVSDGSLLARYDLDRAAGTLLGELTTSAETKIWFEQRLTLAACATELGVAKGALDLTASYAKTREQFQRPIGTFQAVSQRLADGYIDILGTELMLWQAAWRLDEGLSAAIELAGAKLWAADAGHRIAHTTVHVHGGVGIDLDGEAHRYFTVGKLGEFLHGGTTDQSRKVGALLAAEPV